MKPFLEAPQLPGLFIDALVTDSDNQLLFLSAWGSEAYVKQTQAALARIFHQRHKILASYNYDTM